MVLLIFHLIFPTITYDGVDIPFASQVLGYNAARYPRGIFFLFGQGRLALFKGDPMGAIKFYMTGMEVVGGKDALRGLEGVGFPQSGRHSNGEDGSDDGSDQSEFKSLQGLALWELAMARLAMWDVRGSVGCWRRLREEAGWSKSVYAYGLAVGLYELGEEITPSQSRDGAAYAKIPDVELEVVDEQLRLEEKRVVHDGGATEVKNSEHDEAATVMDSVPGLMQRIAGKSIPFEVSFQASAGCLLIFVPYIEIRISSGEKVQSSRESTFITRPRARIRTSRSASCTPQDSSGEDASGRKYRIRSPQGLRGT